MNPKRQRTQIQFSRKLRNCQSPELTRLSHQINDLKRKIATIQTKQTQKSQKQIIKPSSTKFIPKPQPKNKPRREQTTKNTSNYIQKIQQNKANEAESQILKKLELFQQEFQSLANQIHQFMKKLKNQLKLIEGAILRRFKQMKDQITQSVDKDINKFIKAIKKYQTCHSQNQLEGILSLKQKITNRLKYNTEDIDQQLMKLQYQISQTTKNIQLLKFPSCNDIKRTEESLHQNFRQSKSVRSSKQLNTLIGSRGKQHKLQLSKSSQQLPKENSSNLMHHLEEQRKQYNSAKLLLKL